MEANRLRFMTRYSKLKTKHGFALIELLVVLAIILILAGLFFPVFKKVRDQGKRIKCLGNLKQLGAAIQLYMQDDAQGRFPGWAGSCDEVKNLPSLLWPYLGQENQNALLSGELKEFLCPSNRWTSNLSDRVDAWGNRVDFAMNCNLRGQAAVAKIGNDTIAAVLYDQPVYPGNAVDHVHIQGTNFLFADGHAQWLPRNRVSSPWPNVDQYAGTDYENWGLLP